MMEVKVILTVHTLYKGVRETILGLYDRVKIPGHLFPVCIENIMILDHEYNENTRTWKFHENQVFRRISHTPTTLVPKAAAISES